MAYRIDIEQGREGARLVFQGLLDRAATEDLLRRAASAGGAGRAVRVVLAAGTEVEPGCMERVREAPGLSLEAEPPYLARWLEERR